MAEEEPKTEAPKTEEPKTEAPKTEAPKTEAPKTEAPSSREGKNTGMAILAYFGILVLIPLLTTAKTDTYVKFHTKQGLVLLIFFVILNILWVVPVLGWIVGTIGWLFGIVLFIMGIVNAAGGNEKELPLIGQYGSKFNI